MELNLNYSYIRHLLAEELASRVKKNSSYSLRAFAKSINCDPALLSKILNGKRKPSKKFLESTMHISNNLRKEVTALLSETMPTQSTTKKNLNRQIFKIEHETFELISDNIHYKILECTRLDDFEPNCEWVAKKLHTSQHRVKVSVERLRKLNLLKVSEDTWTDLTGEQATHVLGHTITTSAHKSYQKRVLEESLVALENVPMEFRDHSSRLMASSLSKVLFAKKIIAEFREDLCRFLEDTDEKDVLLQLGVSLYPVTRHEKNRKTKTETVGKK